jgi:hypothetical protein
MNNESIARVITFAIILMAFYLGVYIGHKNGRHECENKFMDKFLNDDHHG